MLAKVPHLVTVEEVTGQGGEGPGERLRRRRHEEGAGQEGTAKKAPPRRAEATHEDPRPEARTGLAQGQDAGRRGIGGKGGKTAGRGMKGQRARGTVPVGFEGGQLPLHMRVPKLRGFNNPFRVEYQADQPRHHRGVAASTRSPPTPCASKGLVGKGAFVKVLGRGELTRKVTVKAHAVSKSAEAAITGAGGTRGDRVPLPWGDGRPPAKGNAHTNR